jgi:hypothetical protein
MALDQGSSVDAVKAQLGVPESEFSIGKETILTYVPWRLWFVDDALREKRLERRFRGKRLTGSTLDQGVVGGLKLGSSIEVVKKALGTPDVVESVYQGTSVDYRVLHYGPWELSFRKGRLGERTRN